MRAQTADRMPALDEVIAGKYRVVRIIAEGGMGVVVEAHHVRLDRPVALKILHPNVRAEADVAARFEREARASARITGENVARVLDVDNTEDGTPFIVMELLQGHDLAAELARRKRLQVHEAVAYVLQACMAMNEAHRLGIVHRDLKPSNLFLCKSGKDERVVKVLDFGISKATTIDDVSMTATHSVLGTPLYMSPEQVRSAKTVDARSDIWSLGVILYELLAGQPPFQARSATAIAAAIAADRAPALSTVRDDVPPQLDAVILKALEKSPENRYQTVVEFGEAIAPFGSPETGALLAALRAQSTLRSAIPSESDESVGSSGVRSTPREERTTLTQRRNRRLLGVSGLLVLAGLAALFLRMPEASRDPSQATPQPSPAPSATASASAQAEAPLATTTAALSAPAPSAPAVPSGSAAASAAPARPRPALKAPTQATTSTATAAPVTTPTTATTNPLHL